MKCDTPLEFFELLFDEKLIDLIVRETNNYREYCVGDVIPNVTLHETKWILIR